MELTEVRILTRVVWDVLAARALENGTRVPRGCPSPRHGVGDDVAIDPGDGVPTPRPSTAGWNAIPRISTTCRWGWGHSAAQLLGLLRRSRQTITALADALHLTDNAVRTHIAALERDGIVEYVLFPKAYALVLGGLVEELARRDGWERVTTLLRAVGQRAASAASAPADREGRVAAGTCCRATPAPSRP